MRTRFRNEADDWSNEGQKITSQELLDLIRRTIETLGPVVVEHWYYRGSSAPNRVVFDDYDDFVAYLNEQASAGDAIDVWSFVRVCTQVNQLTSGKCPDEDGLVPKGGAY